MKISIQEASISNTKKLCGKYLDNWIMCYNVQLIYAIHGLKIKFEYWGKIRILSIKTFQKFTDLESKTLEYKKMRKKFMIC